MTDTLDRREARRCLLLYLTLLFLLGWLVQGVLARLGGRAALGMAGPLALAWTPGLALYLLWWVRRPALPDMGLGPTRPAYLVTAYLFPVAFSAVVFGTSWSNGVLDFEVPRQLVDRFGGGTAGGVLLVLFVLTVVFYLALVQAVGEEIGWRGLLLPLMDAAGVPAPALVGSLLWAAWWVPILLFELVPRSPMPELVLPLALVASFSLGVILARERTFCGSTWPAVMLSASFRTHYLALFPLFTRDDPGAQVLIGPAGIQTALYLGVVAAWLILFGKLSERDRDPPPGAAAVA